MSSIIESFASQYLQVSAGLCVSTFAVVDAYVRFNNGSTDGKLKLYAFIKTIPGVAKVRTEFQGLALTQPATPTPAAISEPAAIAEPKPTLVAPAAVVESKPMFVAPVNTMSEYERMCLTLKMQKMAAQKAIEEEKMIMQKAIEERRVAEQKAIEEKKMAAQKAMEERRVAAQNAIEEKKMETKKALKEMEINSNEKMKLMRMGAEAERFERMLVFQREVNNQNRRLTTGIANPRTEYIVLGTASNTHIQYDSAIDNLKELAFESNVEDTLQKCFQNQTVDLPMVDDSIEKAIPLSSMTDIHWFLIQKLTSDLTDKMKKKLAEAYAREQYDDVRDEIDGIDESAVVDAETVVQTCNKEIARLNEIATEARLHSRVHSNSLNRYLDESRKSMDGIGRKSMLAHRKYVVPENEAVITNGGQSMSVKCYCCSRRLDIDDSHRCHVVAKERGGTCDRDNIRLCCSKCNTRMGAMDLELYRSMLTREREADESPSLTPELD